MVREPAHLSDWLEFLNRKVDRNNTLWMASVAVLIALITLFIAVWSFQGSVFSTEIELVALSHSTNTSIDIKNITDFIYSLDILKYTILCVIVFQIGVSFYIPNMSNVKKAKKLLDEIMQNPDEIEVDEIRKKWYGDNVSMTELKNQRNEKIQFGIIFGIPLALGILFIFLGLVYLEKNFPLMLAIDSIGVSIMGLAYALISNIISQRSLNISIESKNISKQSDEKMTALSELSFVEKNAMIHGYIDELKTEKPTPVMVSGQIITTLTPTSDKKIVSNDKLKKIIRDLDSALKVIDYISDETRNNFLSAFIGLSTLMQTQIIAFKDDDIKDYLRIIGLVEKYQFEDKEKSIDNLKKILEEKLSNKVTE
ncbi:MAG: hypothetical protein IMZ52_00900 [Actinobacteria bacterium]|nr:hypothetical protein [Actinomycetota bacterium]MBE3121998.1 hypothetical protein [Thermoplasmata archaeon]